MQYLESIILFFVGLIVGLIIGWQNYQNNIKPEFEYLWEENKNLKKGKYCGLCGYPKKEHIPFGKGCTIIDPDSKTILSFSPQSTDSV